MPDPTRPTAPEPIMPDPTGPAVTEPMESVIKHSTLERFIKAHSVTTRIGPDTLIDFHEALDRIVLHFVKEVGEEAERAGHKTILPPHIQATMDRIGGGAPPVPGQLVDVIDRLTTDDLARLVNLVRARLQQHQQPPTTPLPAPPTAKP